ncbi:MAG: hypothetical protein Aurels2KO_27510 [Aureliella sp.]
MPKALCLIGLVLSILICLVFLFDLVAGLAGSTMVAPLLAASYSVDIMFILASAALAWVAWSTFREQK